MDLMEFSMTEGNDTLTGDENFLPPQLMQTPVVVNSILKPSTKGNLMQLHTPKPPQKLKVKFETPHSVKKVTPTRYEKIADLDEKENWIERTAIVTKTDHIDNIECAKEIVASLVDNLPLSKSESKTDKPGNEIDDDETFFDASEEIKNGGPATHSASIPLIPSQEHVTVQTQQNSSNTLSTLAPQQVASPLPVSVPHQVASPLPVSVPHQVASPLPVSAQQQAASPLPVSAQQQVASPLPVSAQQQVASPLPVSAQQQAASPLPVSAQQQVASPLPVSAQQQVASPLPVSAIPTDPGILDVSMECCEADTMMTDEPMDCDETMLQTTVICNQTLVGNKTLGQEIVQNSAPPTVTSPPLPASKGGYSIDFDNLDSFNPFQTKAAITNSPVLNVEISSKEDGGKPSADPVEAGDGKKPSVEPVGICRGELDAETPEGILDIEADVDTDLLSEVLPGNTGDQLEKGGYSLDLDENADPFATKTQIKNSPLSDAHQTKQPEFDTNKTTVNNSQSLNGDNTTPKRPVKADDADPFSTKSKVNNSPTNVLKNSNPFATKANLCNSPVLPTGNILAKSPVVPATGMTVEKPLGSEVSALSIVQPTLDAFNSCDPFATKSTVVNSPVPGSHIMENVSNAKQSSSEVSQNDGLQSDEGKVPDIKFDLDIDLLAPSSMIVTGSENVVKNVCDESVTLIRAAPIADTGLRTVNDDSGNHPTITQLTVSNPVLTSVTAKDDTLADLDPFSTKSKVANSPAATMDPFSTKSKVANSPAATLDPFSTKSKVANSPAAKQSEDEMIDPFSSKSKVANSPAVKQPEAPMVDPFSTKLKVANSPAAKQSEDEMIDPFSTKSKVANSPTQKEPEAPMIDPFSTKSKVANSPTAKSSDNAMVDCFSTKSKVVNSPTQKEPEAPMIDPFSTKSKVANSPALKQPEDPTIDPFSAKSKVANSPTVKQLEDPMIDPFSTKSKVANSPTVKQLEDPMIDPFSTKSKVANSPTVKQLEDPMIDPFSTKSKVANSPTAKSSDDAMDDPFSTKSKVANSPALKQPEDPMIDPFSTKSKVANSPAVKQTENPMIEPFSTMSKVANSPTAKSSDDAMDDPFSTKSKVANSPALKQPEDPTIDPFSAKSKVANSPTVKQLEDPMIDPFSTKSKVANSPTVKQLEDPMIDPFSTKSKVANSPAAKSSDDAMVDPFSTKSKVTNSPALKQPEDPTIDPFSAKSKVANSPAAKSSEDPMIDPFSTKSKVANSPTAKPAEDPNPFATKSKVPNSPSGPGLTENTAPTRHISGKSASDNKVLDAKTDPFLASVSNEAVFPDEEFRPATECLFNDSSFLDVLEKFGSSSAENKVSDLARMSLYVKFDPLVDLPPTDPRRASMNLLKRASIMNMPRKSLCGKSIADVCNSEESMLLMGTPPKQMSRLANVTGRPHHTGFTPGSIPTTPKSLKPQLDLLCANTPPPSAKKFVTPAPEKKNSNLPEEPEDSLAASSDDNIIEVLQYTDKDMYEMKKEVFLEFQGQKLLLEREWTKVVDQLKAKIEDQNKALEKKQTDIDQMGFVSKELEIIVEGLIKETENLKSANEDLKKERDQSVQDTQSLEKAFSELHRRNEKLKELMSGYMKNEETLKEHAKELQKVLSTVKTESKEKITELSQQLAKAKSDLNQITASSEARTKRDKLQIESLQKTVEQKMSENKDLTQMCDELLAKVTQ